MSKFYNEFEEGLGIHPSYKKVCLQIGAPGPHILKDVAQIIKEATIKHFDSSNPRNEEILQYGCSAGSQDLLEELAKYLTEMYRNPVLKENMFIHTGASQAMANILYHYFQSGQTLFVEDPTYWNFISDLGSGKSTFAMKAVGIKMDDKGLKMDELEKHLKALGDVQLSERYPFRAALYVIPVHQNPTGRIMTENRCRELVKLARRYDLLIISDDVYNVLTYWAPDCDDPVKVKPPARLFSYDNKDDPNCKGHVVSVGSMSKSMAPGLRLGWYEMPERILSTFKTIFVTTSGAAWNPYTSGIIAHAFKLGLVQKQISKCRVYYLKIINKVNELVTRRLGKCGVHCNRPNGGVFMWVTLPVGISTSKILEKCKEELTFITGKRCSVSNSFHNCLRLSICFYEEDLLLSSIEKLCDYIEASIHDSNMD